MPFAVNDLPCVDPDLLRKQFGSALDLLDGCNSYTCPLGESHGLAHVLMHKADFDRLNESDYVTLTVRDGYGRTVTVPYLTVIGSAAAYQTDSTRRANAVVRVTLADRRWRWKLVPVGRTYNYRNSAGAFTTASQNGGVDWTWATMLADLWSKLTTVYPDAGTAPTFPTAPAGAPEGFNFTGWNVWRALNRVCHAAGYVVKFDGTTARVTVVDPGTTAPVIPPTPPRTFDDGLWTDPTEWVTSPVVPAQIRVSFPRPLRSISHDVDVAAQQPDGRAGTKGGVWDDLPAIGETVSNTTALNNRAAAVAKLWEFDRYSRANPNRIEFRGWQSWVTTALGYDSWTRWAVYDRGNSSDGLVGGVMSCVNNLDPLGVEYKPGAADYLYVPLNTQNVDGTAVDPATTEIRADQDTYVLFESVAASGSVPAYQKLKLDVDGLAGELSLTTGNTSDGGAEDSTTTLLRFADPTGVRVDAGATAGDADIVTLTFGQSITFVECVSLVTTSSGGNLTSATLAVKKRTLTISDGAEIGPALCEENPAVCCEPGVTFDGCSHVYPTTIYFTFTSTGGDCTCFTGTVTLTWDASDNRWEGTFSGCTGTVNFTVGVNDFAAPTEWVITVAGSSYTFAYSGSAKVFVCNDLPTGVKVNAEGACTGFFIGDFSE